MLRFSVAKPGCLQSTNSTRRTELWKGLVQYSITDISIAALLLLMLASCEKKRVDYPSARDVIVESAQELKVFSLDTTIELPTNAYPPALNKQIVPREAEMFLYKYFKDKGIKPRKEIKELSDKNAMIDCVMYDTIYVFNTDKLSGAVVSYWLGPASLNGRGFQPDKAIILNTGKGYKIIKEGFISADYAIDSSSANSIYGTFYQYQEEESSKNFKITLK